MTWERRWEDEGLGAVGQQRWTARVNGAGVSESFTVCSLTEVGAIHLAQEATAAKGCRIHVQEQDE